jgi:plasmid stabilization system protein ParE
MKRASRDLGRFLAAVEEAVERIARSPRAGGSLASGFRKRLVPGFPFSVVYRPAEEQIFIVAVAHQHRRPGY